MNYKEKVLIALNNMNLINYNNKEIIVKAKYGPSKETKIPLVINEELSCFIAAIIGDGHLKKNKFQISLDGFDLKLINRYKIICKRLFKRNFNVCKWIENEKYRYCLRIDSKAIYEVLKKVFKIPSGKKSNIVKIPKFIKENNKSIKASFIIGILVTEGGKRKRGFGLSTSSKGLWKDLIYLFKEIKINVKKDKWIYKKYNKEYYGISFKKEEINKILNKVKNKNVRKILIKSKNFN
jgi:hypothetical protein